MTLRMYVAVVMVVVLHASVPALAGTLDVIPEAAFAGDRGMRVVIDDVRATFVEDDVGALSSYSARFYANLDDLSFNADGAFDLFAGTDGGGVNVFRLFVERTGDDTSLRYAVLVDGALELNIADGVALTSGWHRIALTWTAGNGSGELNVFLDGVGAEPFVNLTNVNSVLRSVRLGVASVLSTNGAPGPFVHGSMDIDEFVSRESGLIGVTPTTIGIGDVRVNVDTATSLIDLFNAFSDAEDADNEMTYAAVANSNPALFSSTAVDITAGNLVLVYVPDTTGFATLTVRATDTNDLFVETRFDVTVSGPPTTTGIDDVSVNANASDTVIDLFSAFADAEDPDEALGYSLTSNSNTPLFTQVAIDGAAGTLTLDYMPDMGGVAELIVRATDPGGLFVETAFTVMVNGAPTTSGIADVTVTAGTAQSVIDLRAAFADAEDADADLVYALESNSNPSLFSAAAVDNAADTLVLAYADGVTGTSEITVRATDSGGLSVSTGFTVTVNPQTGGTGCHGGIGGAGAFGDVAVLVVGLLVVLGAGRRRREAGV